MRFLTTVILSIFSFMGASIAQPKSAVQYTKLKVNVTGITTLKGTIRATLDANPRAFENDAPPYLTMEVPANAIAIVLQFDDVAPGDYAMKIIHDENDDGKLNQNFLGIPSEKYGISNNIKGRFGLPAFDAARFTVKDHETSISITLEHHKFF